MKNKFILWLVRTLQRPRTGPRNQRILVVTTTALGDTLWATPALASLRSSFPRSYIALLTSPLGEQVLRYNPAIDRIYILREPLLSRFFSLWRTLYREQFDTVIVLHASQRLTLPLCALLGAETIIGTPGINKGLDSLLTDPVPPKYQHEIVRRLELVERAGAKRTTEMLSFFLQPKERLHLLKPKPLIALHPGSKDTFKRWPAEHFIAVGQQLQKLGLQILVTGTKEEIPLMEHIASQIPDARAADPHLPLRAFAALLEQVDLLISNDTGPVHLACALQKPVIALYAPLDPLLCGPHKAPQATAIAKRTTCQPCLKRRCLRPFCLLQIGPEEVVVEALKWVVRVVS